MTAPSLRLPASPPAWAAMIRSWRQTLTAENKSARTLAIYSGAAEALARRCATDGPDDPVELDRAAVAGFLCCGVAVMRSVSRGWTRTSSGIRRAHLVERGGS
ncbi:hypothetical protein ACG83_14610 [Frankia sp. R43]|nr:hypothetical protein ACG83_14610 [Frankia sp. R43]